MKETGRKALSKSRYLAGLQCDKKLWTEVHASELVPPVDPTIRARFDTGHEVGALATGLFPGGLEIGGANRDWERLVTATAQALTQGRPLYEAAFSWGGAACRVDILVPHDSGSWQVCEVKSASGVKEVHLEDLALQAYVIEGSGLEVNDYNLVHIDTSYVRRGDLDLGALFRVERVTEKIRERIGEIAGRLDRMQLVLDRPQPPMVSIGPHCTTPYGCGLRSECWRFLPTPSVLDLTHDSRLGFDLLNQGVLELVDVPSTADLSRRQRIQFEAVRSGSPQVDRIAIVEFLERLAYPISFLDIETFGPAVPQFDKSRPYQPIPFLFSVHRVERPGAPARHFAYLVEGDGDPRREFLRGVHSSLGTTGSIVSYNASFEAGVIARTALDVLPELERWSGELRDRFVDLHDPFRDFAYHHPEQYGRTGLKNVLTPLTGLSYLDLSIADGEQAGREFERARSQTIDAGERAGIYRNLIDYCSLDTLGMVAIVDELGRLSGLEIAGESEEVR